MQIWRTTRSAPGTSLMKARLVGLWCFVLTMFPQRRLASSSIWSVLFRCGYELLCFWTPRERIVIFHRSPLRETLSKQNIKAQLASLSWDSSRAPTEWSAIFALGVCSRRNRKINIVWGGEERGKMCPRGSKIDFIAKCLDPFFAHCNTKNTNIFAKSS